MMVTFFKAYVHPSKTVTVTINEMGEANPEFIFLLLMIPITFYLGYLIRQIILPALKKEML